MCLKTTNCIFQFHDSWILFGPFEFPALTHPILLWSSFLTSGIRCDLKQAIGMKCASCGKSRSRIRKRWSNHLISSSPALHISVFLTLYWTNKYGNLCRSPKYAAKALLFVSCRDSGSSLQGPPSRRGLCSKPDVLLRWVILFSHSSFLYR